jgi:hypothetical protein
MPNCPKCNHLLRNAPEDAREWFRCENCGASLRLPSSISKGLYWLCIFGPAFGAVAFSKLLSKYFHMKIALYAIEGAFLAIYAAATRLLWKTRWSRPQLYDPYSAFNFTESSRKED